MLRPADEAAAFGADNLFLGGADQADRHRVGVHDDMGLGVNDQHPGLDVIQDGLKTAFTFPQGLIQPMPMNRHGQNPGQPFADLLIPGGVIPGGVGQADLPHQLVVDDGRHREKPGNREVPRRGAGGPGILGRIVGQERLAVFQDPAPEPLEFMEYDHFLFNSAGLLTHGRQYQCPGLGVDIAAKSPGAVGEVFGMSGNQRNDVLQGQRRQQGPG